MDPKNRTRSAEVQKVSNMQHQTKLFHHAEAVNLARRYSVQNENDLLQVCTITVENEYVSESGPTPQLSRCTSTHLFLVTRNIDCCVIGGLLFRYIFFFLDRNNTGRSLSMFRPQSPSIDTSRTVRPSSRLTSCSPCPNLIPDSPHRRSAPHDEGHGPRQLC